MEQKKIRTYILYAAGEILLVVIGILIALQVNNWNEKRKEANITRDILENLYVDIEEDLDNIESLKEMLAGRKRHADYLLSVIHGTGQNLDSLKMIQALTRVGWILNYSPAFATYNEITNSGRLSLIQNVELKKRLADYKSQVTDNKRIESSYESGLKEAELLALSFFTSPPPANNLFKDIPEDVTSIPIDLDKMKTNEDFINHLKHISYHTATEILYKDNFIIPRAKGIREVLEKELKGS